MEESAGREPFAPSENEIEVAKERAPEAELAELSRNAETALRDFIAIIPEEKVLFTIDSGTNRQTLKILREAVERIGAAQSELMIDSRVRKSDVNKLLPEVNVIINLEGGNNKATRDVYEDIKKYGNRMLALFDADPTLFASDGPLSENRQEMEERLNHMEAVLKDASGFHITSTYGTDLKVGMRPFGDRRWAKDPGIINQPGQWDNLPGGEIYTTPQDNGANGVLVLSSFDTDVSAKQGVDELVRLTIEDGVITNISGGKSADKLRKHMEKSAREQITDEGENPWSVFRIAEIAFGANSKARYTVREDDSKGPATPTVEAEKRFGTMHLAFGSAKHGEEGVEGYEDAVSHLDFVLPRAGLTVEMFSRADDFKKGKNGRKLINNGGVNF